MKEGSPATSLGPRPLLTRPSGPTGRRRPNEYRTPHTENRADDAGVADRSLHHCGMGEDGDSAGANVLLFHKRFDAQDVIGVVMGVDHGFHGLAADRTKRGGDVTGGGQRFKRVDDDDAIVSHHHRRVGETEGRERIEALLDEGSYFLEVAPLAGFGMDGEVPGAGIIGGIGLVEGRECLIIANEATAKGGATGEPGLLKNARLADIARENHLPTILLVEAAGADLPQQSKVFVPGGRGFREITRRSKMRIPTVSVVFGPSTAGGAYLPGMSD